MSEDAVATAEQPKKRRTRGPSKKPTLAVTSIRLPKDVLEYFTTTYPVKKQAKMREVLTNFVKEQTNAKVDGAEGA